MIIGIGSWRCFRWQVALAGRGQWIQHAFPKEPGGACFKSPNLLLLLPVI